MKKKATKRYSIVLPATSVHHPSPTIVRRRSLYRSIEGMMYERHSSRTLHHETSSSNLPASTNYNQTVDKLTSPSRSQSRSHDRSRSPSPSTSSSDKMISYSSKANKSSSKSTSSQSIPKSYMYVVRCGLMSNQYYHQHHPCHRATNISFSNEYC